MSDTGTELKPTQATLMWVIAAKASNRENFDYIWLYDASHRALGLGRVKCKNSKPSIVVSNIRRSGDLSYVYSMGHGVIFKRGRNPIQLSPYCSLNISVPDIDFS